MNPLIHRIGRRGLRTWREWSSECADAIRLRHLSPPQRALGWIRSQALQTGGVRVNSRMDCGYPEVSGYLVPTLLEYGERRLAEQLVRWLICIQRADGSFPDADHDTPRLFDTGQVLRGLLAGIDLHPAAREAAGRAAGYLIHQLQPDAGWPRQYADEIPESVLLYNLPTLREAARILGEPRFEASIDPCLAAYMRRPDALQADTLTHFLGYEIEALIDLGHADRVRPLLDQLQELQAPDGAVRARRDARWICTPGLAQLAICWYKIGADAAADRALGWLERHQRAGGGWRGSHGWGAAYFPDVTIPWTAKFYLDAHLLRVVSFFRRNAAAFPDAIDPADGRVRAVLEGLPADARILDVGCGKGRFLRAIRATLPRAQLAGLDLSPELLAHAPPGIDTRSGRMERLPFEDDVFDLVFSVEAIEHSANPGGALREMIRVTRPGGRVLVIDKHRGAWGRLPCPPWERWPAREGLAGILREHCDDVSARDVALADPGTRGLMVAWQGLKRGPVPAAGWGVALHPAVALVEQQVRAHQVTPWAGEIVLSTRPGDTVLEVGCGTGAISIQLARAGRRVTALDMDGVILQAVAAAARRLEATLTTAQADACGPLPFADACFDCVWSSGLLEHFAPATRVAMLREQARVSRHLVIGLVPNASSLAYQAGRALSERAGTWVYGRETALASLRPDFEAAGIRVVRETTVAPAHALQFLPARSPLRRQLRRLFDAAGAQRVEGWNQGYLVCTIGAIGRDASL